MHPIATLMYWLAAADLEILERCPGERRRMATTGAAVLMTGVIAGLASALTAHAFMHTGWPATITAGLLWASAIIVFDRWALASLHRHRRKLMTLLLAAPRVLLAVVAGYVFAKPIEIAMFKPEVAYQAHIDVKQTMLADRTKLDRYYTPQIKSLGEQQTNLENKASSGGAATFLNDDPIYRNDLAQAQKLQTEASVARGEMICELAGTCGTQHAGPGLVYEAKRARYVQLAQQATSAQAAEQTRAHVLEDQQRGPMKQSQRSEEKDLAQVGARLTALRRQQSAAEQQLSQQASRPLGLADRLDALSKVESSSGTVGDFTVGISLLILLIDAGPVIGKTLLLLGPKTMYEKEQRRRERHDRAVADAYDKATLKAAKVEASEIVDHAETHRALWKQVVEELVAKIISTERAVWETTIAAWSKHERAAAQRAADTQRYADEQSELVGADPHEARMHGDRRRTRFGRRG